AQTRQADRDEILNDADTQHRETLAQASLRRQEIADSEMKQLKELLEANTDLTRQVEALTAEIHTRIVGSPA
ncbi:MAG: hypothetical protein OEM39_03250, partial [Acidimicrobiia bacterium]|nr:hypothetical protein [Acidimicrobiia bacterium]